MSRRFTYNAICDVCGFKFKAWQLKQRWDGLRVCHLDWETRHPQDMIKTPRDDQSIPWSRPEPADVFVAESELPSPYPAIEDIPEGHFTTNNETP